MSTTPRWTGDELVVLSPDHPGFHDAEYRARRNAIAQLSLDYDGNGPVPVVEYTDRDGMLSSDMDQHKASWRFEPPADPTSPYTFVLTPDSRTNFVSYGGLSMPVSLLIPNFCIGQFDNGRYLQFAPDGSLASFDVGVPTGGPVWSIGVDGLDLPEVQGMFTPLERVLVNSFAHYEIVEGVEVFGEIWAARTKATLLARQPAYQTGFFSA